MARPIDATPVLRGEDAIAFLKAAQNPRPYTPPKFDLDKMHAFVQKTLKKRGKK